MWTVEQLTEFLTFVRDDRLFVLWWLIALRGLRRAEVTGLRWIDLDTLRLLRRHERAQRGEQGDDRSPSAPMFTRTNGEAIDHKLALASGLPPVRLHDLRHGAALTLAAGADLRVVQGLLGHASIVLTADTYTSVLPQLYHDNARATARLVSSAARKTARMVRNGRRRT
ncbi:tyrosine-type recombinase/integrase [Nonomuraea sp. NPDC052116]|uniref:tyrosine-type recombinase/integrase n=1 Tax=Nonomuraea sp. NPDC052116 TaxID=3155665 RepID=UPI00341B8262